MKINSYLFGLLFLCSFSLTAQKEITLADIWKNGTFTQKGIQNLNWAADGQSYLELKSDSLHYFEPGVIDWCWNCRI
jgi:hypothetical protein